MSSFLEAARDAGCSTCEADRGRRSYRRPWTRHLPRPNNKTHFLLSSALLFFLFLFLSLSSVHRSILSIATRSFFGVNLPFLDFCSSNCFTIAQSLFGDHPFAAVFLSGSYAVLDQPSIMKPTKFVGLCLSGLRASLANAETITPRKFFSVTALEAHAERPACAIACLDGAQAQNYDNIHALCADQQGQEVSLSIFLSPVAQSMLTALPPSISSSACLTNARTPSTVLPSHTPSPPASTLVPPSTCGSPPCPARTHFQSGAAPLLTPLALPCHPQVSLAACLWRIGTTQ